jgi:Ca2+-binding RTX toxin-like protein
VNSFSTYTLGTDLEHLVLAGTANLGGTGNAVANRITGNDANNIVNGLAGSDTLTGAAGNDTLRGGNGNDSLDGGAGNDSMDGGAGNDRYVVDVVTDRVVELAGGGIDSVSAGIGFTLPPEVEKLTLTGSGTIDGTGNGAGNTITGNGKANSLVGAGGNDSLGGMDGNDKLSGGSGDDTLHGGAGNDRLSGNAGIDVFRFASALGSNNNVDHITDFSVVDDRLQLENAVFAKLTATGVLSSSFFRAGTTGNAVDDNDFVLYDTDGGQLFYDADGSGAGVKVLVATLSGIPALASADIFVT